jgi:hypothetical protein
VTGTVVSITTDEGIVPKMAVPGDCVKMGVELMQPIAIGNNMRFAMNLNHIHCPAMESRQTSPLGGRVMEYGK